MNLSQPMASNPEKQEKNIRTSQTAGYYAAFIALGLCSASLGATLPGLAANTRTTLSGISILFTARSLGYLIGSFQGGRWYDHFRAHPLMGGFIILMAFSMVFMPVLPVLWLLIITMGVLGFAEGAIDVGGNTLLVWVHREKVAPFMNGLHAFFGIGSFIAPLVIAQAILAGGSITWAYWALALLLLPTAFMILRAPTPTNPAIDSGQAVIQVKWSLLGLFVVFFFLFVGAEASFGNWIYTYSLKMKLANEVNAAYLNSAFWGALTAGRLAGIPLALRFKPKTILWADLAGSILGTTLVLLVPGSLEAAWVGTMLVGFSLASIYPTTIALASRQMSLSGKITRWFMVGASAGSMTIPWLIGQLFETSGARTTMVVILFCVLAAAAVFARISANHLSSSQSQ